MMQHLIVLPVVLPLLVGLFLLRSRHGTMRTHRVVGVTATALLVVVAMVMVARAAGGEVTYYALGGWQPPFGIVLVLDRLSALMVLLTAVLALGAVVFACAGDDEREATSTASSSCS